MADLSRYKVAMSLLNEWRTAANNVDAPYAFESIKKVWQYEEWKLRNEILELMGVDDPETAEEIAEREAMELYRANEDGPGDNVLLNQSEPEPKHIPGIGAVDPFHQGDLR